MMGARKSWSHLLIEPQTHKVRFHIFCIFSTLSRCCEVETNKQKQKKTNEFNILKYTNKKTGLDSRGWVERRLFVTQLCIEGACCFYFIYTHHLLAAAVPNLLPVRGVVDSIKEKPHRPPFRHVFFSVFYIFNIFNKYTVRYVYF